MVAHVLDTYICRLIKSFAVYNLLQNYLKWRGRERVLIKQDWPYVDYWHFVVARCSFMMLISLLLYIFEIFL